MLELNIRYTVQSVMLAVAMCIAGVASAAQESGLISAAPDGIQQAGGDMAAVGVAVSNASGISTTKTTIPETTSSPAPRMTWDLAAPELDTFGNETVPIFNSTYSGR
jgi:hypothetical protein